MHMQRARSSDRRPGSATSKRLGSRPGESGRLAYGAAPLRAVAVRGWHMKAVRPRENINFYVSRWTTIALFGGGPSAPHKSEEALVEGSKAD